MPERTKRWAGGPPVRGLHIVLGWQKDRILLELPYQTSIGVLGVGIVWVTVLLSTGNGADWAIALAFAQVVAASISILLTSVRR